MTIFNLKNPKGSPVWMLSSQSLKEYNIQGFIQMFLGYKMATTLSVFIEITEESQVFCQNSNLESLFLEATEQMCSG